MVKNSDNKIIFKITKKSSSSVNPDLTKGSALVAATSMFASLGLQVIFVCINQKKFGMLWRI